MATINDLPIKNFSDMSDEELLERIKELRSSRRSPDPVIKEKCRKKAISKQKRGKAIALQSVDKFLEGITPEQAKKILQDLKGE